MINAVLYSDQIIPANNKVDDRLVEMLAARGRRIGYIPSGPESDCNFYRGRKAYYARRDLVLDVFFDLDGNHDNADIAALFACDAIHLSGGDTAAFLARLKRSGLFGKLRNWARKGGVVIGASAGSILMTPTIAVGALLGGKRPQDVEDAEALDLLPFEFFPHLQARSGYLTDLLAYSKQNACRIAACPDGDGIVVKEGVIEAIGDVTWITNGSVDSCANRAKC